MLFQPQPMIMDVSIATLAYVNSVIANASSITAMTGVQIGDLLVMLDSAYRVGNNSPPTYVLPTNFTLISTEFGNANGDAWRGVFSYKIAVGDESSKVLSGMAQGTYNRKLLLQYRAETRLTLLAASTPNKYVGGGDPPSQTIAAASGVAPVLGIAAASHGSSYGTLSSTPADHTWSPGGSGSLIVKDRIQLASPQNYACDADNRGNLNALVSFYLHSFQG
jgi:hypothetical protein